MSESEHETCEETCGPIEEPDWFFGFSPDEEPECIISDIEDIADLGLLNPEESKPGDMSFNSSIINHFSKDYDIIWVCYYGTDDRGGGSGYLLVEREKWTAVKIVGSPVCFQLSDEVTKYVIKTAYEYDNI
jgi:hypothetical protein